MHRQGLMPTPQLQLVVGCGIPITGNENPSFEHSELSELRTCVVMLLSSISSQSCQRKESKFRSFDTKRRLRRLRPSKKHDLSNFAQPSKDPDVPERGIASLWSGSLSNCSDNNVETSFELHSAASVIQKWCRWTKAARLFIVSVELMQRNFRMTKIKNQYRVIKWGIMMLQRIVRNFFYRRRLSSAITIQRWWLWNKSAWKFTVAAVKIQSFCRMLISAVAFKKYVHGLRTVESMFLTRSTHTQMAVITLQATARAYLNRLRFCTILDAVKFTSSNFRRKRFHDRYRQTKCAAIIIQIFWKRRQYELSSKLRYSSIVIIQSAARLHLNLVSFLKSIRSLRFIQSFMRMARSRRKYTINLKHIKSLQSLVRRYLSCKKFRLTMGKVLYIQRVARMLPKFRRYHMMMKLVVLMQALFRSFCQQNNFSRYRSRIMSIQRAVRVFLASKRYHTLRELIIIVQSSFRRWAYRSRFLRHKSSIVVIQRRIRRFRHVQLLTVATFSANVIIAKWRGRQSYTWFSLLRAQTCHLQALCRQIKARRKYNAWKIAALKIQSYARRFFATKAKRKVLQAVTLIQRKVRAQQTASNYRLLIDCIVLLQATTRRCTSQTRFTLIKKRTMVLQSLIRMLCIRRKFKLYIRKIKILQCTFKRYIVKLRYLKAVATTVQTYFRRFSCRRAYLYVVNAVIMLQSGRRRGVAMKSYAKMMDSRNKMDDASIVISSFFRCIHSRRGFILKSFQVIVIQCCIRRFLAQVKLRSLIKSRIIVNMQTIIRRNQASRKIIRVKAATVLAASWRGAMIKRLYVKKRQNILMVQSILRKCISIRNLDLRRITRKRELASSADHVSSSWRRFSAHRAFAKLRACVLVIQKYWRRFHAERTVQAVLLSKMARHVAAIIVAFLKMHICRRKFVVVRRAVVLIQSFFRTCIFRRSVYWTFLQSIRSLQMNFRHSKLRNASKVRCVNATIIQAAFRIFRLGQERKYVLFRRTAATKIQSYVRCHIAYIFKMRACRAVSTIRCWLRMIKTRKQCRLIFEHGQYAAAAHVDVVSSLVPENSDGFPIFSGFNIATRLQAWYRCMRSRHRYLRILRLVTKLQAQEKRRIGRIVYNIFCSDVIRVQSYIRRWQVYRSMTKRIAMITSALLWEERVSEAVLRVQRWTRSRVCRFSFLLIREFVVRIQSLLRGCRSRALFKKVLKLIARVQARFRSIFRRRCFIYKIIRFQALVRGCLIRVRLGDDLKPPKCHPLKSSDAAAFVIQTAVRSRQAFRNFNLVSLAGNIVQRQARRQPDLSHFTFKSMPCEASENHVDHDVYTAARLSTNGESETCMFLDIDVNHRNSRLCTTSMNNGERLVSLNKTKDEFTDRYIVAPRTNIIDAVAGDDPPILMTAAQIGKSPQVDATKALHGAFNDHADVRMPSLSSQLYRPGHEETKASREASRTLHIGDGFRREETKAARNALRNLHFEIFQSTEPSSMPKNETYQEISEYQDES